MADEWSKPVKERDGVWSSSDETQHGERGEFAVVEVEGADVRFLHDVHDGMTAPRDVVLRLLAAEASDRLGWVWEVGVDKFTGRLAASRPQWPAQWEVFFDGTITSESEWGCPGTPDELLAAMHGRFLLEDALREAQ